MTAEQLKAIFEKKYNRPDWYNILKEKFNVKTLLEKPIDISQRIRSNTYNAKAWELGNFTTGKGHLIGIYEVEVSEKSDITRNRKGLRNLLSQVYSNDVDAALLVFVQGLKWRFSYVSEISVKNEKTGEREKKITDPKRFTYLLGEGERAKTAADRFARIKKDDTDITLEVLEEAFNVEKMSTAFFNEYRRQYGQFVAYITGVDETGKKIKDHSPFLLSAFKGNDKAARDFVKKMLGRIVFLYFLEKKGWLGVPENGKWGDGDENFLSNLFRDAKDKGIFYSNVLAPLFFTTLNTERKNDLFKIDSTLFVKPGYERLRIPYLNGGLFEEEDVNTQFLVFPEELFQNLFAFFDQYNFTVYEDSLEEHTLAVDPEMLGHIFENLLEDNKDKGTFYTPKPIVHYMCRESLTEYLYTKLNLQQTVVDKSKEKISREVIEHFVLNHEAKDIIDYDESVLIALRDVKICDPAIGSGAFPMGLLTEIFQLVETLHDASPDVTEKIWRLKNGWNPAQVKEAIIQNSIYGVDIEKGAVDIARLRFWLSLVVDEDSPKPLPNLDYKIVVGNSLLSKFEDEVIDIDWDIKTKNASAVAKIINDQQVKLHLLQSRQHLYFIAKGDKTKLQREIRDLKIDVLVNQLTLSRISFSEANPKLGGFAPTPKEIKKNLENELKVASYDKTIQRLQAVKKDKDTALNFFDWKLDFPEVMNEKVTKGKTGFDIVIGNPPYGAKINKQENPEVIKRYTDVASGEIETYVLFYYKGIQLINDHGCLCYITPDSWLTNKNSSRFRDILIKTMGVIDVFDFYKPFPTAKDTRVHSVILKPKNFARVIRVKQVLPSNFKNIYRSYSVEQKLIQHYKGNEWRLYLTSEERELFLKMETRSKKLEELYNLKYGLRTGNNNKYITKEITKYPLIGGADIASLYGINWNPKYLKTIDGLPKGYFYESFSFRKVIIQYVRTNSLKIEARWIEAAYIEGEHIPLNSLSYIYPKHDDYKLKYVIAILNSTLMNKYYRAYYTDVNVKPTYLSQLPILDISISIQTLFEKVVDEILKLKEINPKHDTGYLENQLDIMVFKLYNLTFQEASFIIGNTNWMTEKEYNNFHF